VIRDSPIKAVFFDLGDVVVDWPDNSMIYKYVAERFGLDFEDARERARPLVRQVGRGDMGERDLWTQFFSSYGMGLPKDWRTMWVEKFKECAKPNAKVVGIVKALNKNYKVGMITNTEPSHDKWAKKAGWYKHFDVVVVSYKEYFRKPEPEIYMIALDRIGLKAGECIFVDNKEENVRAAEKVGMKGILFSISRDRPEKLIKELRRHGVRI
jgi:epoxide hydrolase-like predicted phosphatase